MQTRLLELALSQLFPWDHYNKKLNPDQHGLGIPIPELLSFATERAQKFRISIMFGANYMYLNVRTMDNFFKKTAHHTFGLTYYIVNACTRGT